MQIRTELNLPEEGVSIGVTDDTCRTSLWLTVNPDRARQIARTLTALANMIDQHFITNKEQI